jgi:DNA repair photolyase
VSVSLSIGTLDEKVWRATEPGAPHPRRRVDAVRQLAAAGIRTGVLLAPVLPGLSDSPAQLEEVVTACVEAGAQSVTAIALHLRPGVREHFMGWLRPRDPGLADDYERRYHRSYLPDEEQKALAARVRAIAERAGARYATPAQARVPAGEAVVP